MEEKTKKIILVFLGFYFLFLGILAIIATLIYREPSAVLWFCYLWLILLGVGILTRNSSFIRAQVNIIFIPLIVWNIDFYWRFLSGNSLWGITDYFFVQKLSLLNFITLQHLYSLPLALFAVYLINKNGKDSWKISFIEILMIFVLSFVLTGPKENVNCVFSSCVKQIPFSGVVYYLIWIIGFFIIILLTNYTLNKLLHKKTRGASPLKRDGL